MIGKKLPEFNLPCSGGAEISSSDLVGSKVVLFFYPRDDTSGCTKEAIEFSERLVDFNEHGVRVFGVSKDSVKSHDKFISKHNLTVTLISDETGTLCEEFGVWKEKQMYGKKFMGIERSSFVIDEAGVVQNEWRKVKVPGHVDDVFKAISS